MDIEKMFILHNQNYLDHLIILIKKIILKNQFQKGKMINILYYMPQRLKLEKKV